MSVRVAIVDDNPGMRDNLAALIGGAPGFACVSCCESAEEAWKLLPGVRPDVVLMDIHLPGVSGIDCVANLKATIPETQIIMFTIDEDSEKVFDSLKAGATGYLVKHVHPQAILDAILDVKNGGAPMTSTVARKVIGVFRKPALNSKDDRPLSLREREVLRWLAKGYRSKEVAEQLRVAVGTVNTHIRHIYEKLHVRSRSEAVAKTLEVGQKRTKSSPSASLT